MNFKAFYFIEKKGVEYDYSSVQADFPEDIAEQVMEFSSKIPDEYIYTKEDDPSYGREDEIHCTVLYGIHSESPDETKEILKDQGPIDIKFGPISFFEQDDYDVMKIEIISDGLHEINSILRDNVEYTNDYPEYKPHCTIAYVTKDYRKDNKIETDAFEEIEHTADSLTFSSKDGEKYDIKIS